MMSREPSTTGNGYGVRPGAVLAGFAALALAVTLAASLSAQAPDESSRSGSDAEATGEPASAAQPPGSPLPWEVAPESGDPMDDLESLVPPDGKWQKDEAGLEYFVTRLPKVPGTVRRKGDDMIVYKTWYKLLLAGEDEDYFYIKIYRVDTEKSDAMQEERLREAEQRRIEIEQTFRYEEITVDRLELQRFDAGLPTRGQWRQGFEVVDMNRDGELDIVHGPPRKGVVTPVVFLGDGKGGWRFWRELEWPSVSLDYGDIAVADVDGDGLLDVGLGIHLRGVLVLRQTQPGRFVSWSEGLPFEQPGRGGDALGFSSRAVEFFDWNGDGRPDLLALGEGARQLGQVDRTMVGLPQSSSYGLVVFLNEGDGSWRASSGGKMRDVFGDSFAFGDFDRDGRTDVATVSYASGYKDLLHLFSEEAIVERAEVASLRNHSWVFGVSAGDFTGDGHDDLVTSFATRLGDVTRRGLDLSILTEEGWQTEPFYVEEGRNNIWSLAAGDLDADGLRDVVATTERGQVLVFLGLPGGKFALEEGPELDPPANCRGYGLALVDLDRDGRDDLVASFAGDSSQMMTYLGVPPCDGGGAIRVWRSVAKPAAGTPSGG